MDDVGGWRVLASSLRFIIHRSVRTSKEMLETRSGALDRLIFEM